MDLVKFVAMLDEGGLFFCRADLLGDPYEGVFTQQSIEAFNQRWSPPEGWTAEWIDLVHDSQRQAYVSCWHVSNVESASLWKLYGNSLALRSTIGRLRAFLPVYGFDLEMVQYIDYSTSHPDVTNVTSPLFFKRLSFAHEQELRAVQQTCTMRDGHFVSEAGPTGKYVKGDLNQLIEAVVVAPLTPAWQLELAIRLSRRLGLLAPIRPSSMDMPPPQVGRGVA